jgi:hypothetical protein
MNVLRHSESALAHLSDLHEHEQRQLLGLLLIIAGDGFGQG